MNMDFEPNADGVFLPADIPEIGCGKFFLFTPVIVYDLLTVAVKTGLAKINATLGFIFSVLVKVSVHGILFLIVIILVVCLTFCCRECNHV